MREILLNGKKIGDIWPIFLIAEAGINHNGEISIAKQLIDLAAEAKVDAIKFQTFITNNVLLRTTPKANYQKISDVDIENYYDMVKKYEFSKQDFKNLNDYASKKNIIFLSSACDEISLEWLDELNVPAYKIGSSDMNNFPLLKLICSKKKPILLSTGMATLEEVKESVNFIKSNNIEELIVFQCTTNYPALFESINLNVIDTYKREFPNLLIGFSDHSLGIEASIGAVAKGVKAIEKHFTLDKEMKGPDHKSSLDPNELIKWVQEIRNVEKALGSNSKVPSKDETDIAKIARKSIVSIKDLRVGDYIKREDIAVKRPGYGIPPTHFFKIIGKKIKKNIQKDSIIFWDDIE